MSNSTCQKNIAWEKPAATSAVETADCVVVEQASIPLAQRTLLVFIIFAMFTDMLIYEMVVPILPKFVEPWGISESAIGFMFSAFAATVLASNPLFGLFVDRAGCRLPLICGALGLCVSSALPIFADGFFWLVLSRIGHGASGAAVWTGGMALIAATYPREKRGQVMGSVMSGISMGTLLGPFLGGVLFERVGARAPFVAGAVLTALAAAALWWFVPKTRVQQNSASTDSKKVWHQSLTGLWTKPAFRTVFTVVVVGGMLLCLLEPTLPQYLEKQFQAGPEAIGALFLIATLAYGVVSPLVGIVSDRWGRRATMAGGLISAALVLPLTAVPSSWLGLTAAMIAFGMCCAMLLTPALPEMAEAAESCESADYGTAYAWFNMAYALGMVIGTGPGAWIADHFNFFVALTTASAMALACLPILLLDKHRSHRDDSATTKANPNNVSQAA